MYESTLFRGRVAGECIVKSSSRHTMKFQWEFFLIVALLVFEAVDSQETCSGPSKTFSLSKDDLKDPTEFLDEVRLWVREVSNKPTTSTSEVSTTTTEISNTPSPGTASANATLTGSYAATSTDISTATQSEVETTTDPTFLNSVNAADFTSTSAHVSSTANSEGGATATPSQEDASHSTVANIFLTPPTEGYTTITTNAFTPITSEVDAITTSSSSDTTTNAEVSPTYRSQKTTKSKTETDSPEICKALSNEFTFCYLDTLSNKNDVNYTTEVNICQGNSGIFVSIPDENGYILGALIKDIRAQTSQGSIRVWAGTELVSVSVLSSVGENTYASTSCSVGSNSEKRVALHIHTTGGVNIQCMKPSFGSKDVICQPDLSNN